MSEFDSKNMSVEERLDFIEFRQQLLFSNCEVDRLLFEYNIINSQHKEIMGLMEKYQDMIRNGEKVRNASFEQDMYEIVKHLKGDYHFCEYITKAFMNQNCFEEVFPALYGNMTKYK